MSIMKKKAAISFTGGKDSSLALHLFKQPPKFHDNPGLQLKFQKYDNIEPVLLVTFVPSGALGTFKAHSLALMEKQAECLGLTYKLVEVSAPFLETYKKRIVELKDEGIDYLVTGDMQDVCDGFMRRAAQGTGVELLCPLWQIPVEDFMTVLWSYDMKVIVTCVNSKKFLSNESQAPNACCCCGSSGGTCTLDNNSSNMCESKCTEEASKSLDFILGRTLDKELASFMKEKFPHVDPLGEYGEYHTMMIDSSLMKQRLRIESEPAIDGDYHYLSISKIEVIPKQEYNDYSSGDVLKLKDKREKRGESKVLAAIFPLTLLLVPIGFSYFFA